MAGRAGAAVWVRQGDIGKAVDALVEAVSGEERRRQIGVENHVEQLDIPIDAVAPSNHGFGAERCPRQAEPRGEFTLRRVVDIRRLRRGDAQVGQRRTVGERRIEGGQVVVLVGGGGVVLPAQPKIQSQVGQHAEIILREQVGGRLREGRPRCWRRCRQKNG